MDNVYCNILLNCDDFICVMQHAVDLLELVEKVHKEKLFHDGMYGLFNRVSRLWSCILSNMLSLLRMVVWSDINICDFD
jgi:hypothetical protein